MVKTRSFLTRLRGARLLGAGLLLILGAAGCTSVPTGAAGVPLREQAEIAVTNLTPYPWRIAVRSPQGEPVKSVSVQPREVFAVVLPAGDYVIEQTLISNEEGEGGTRQFPARFEAGQRYGWSLATLLSTDEVVTP